jgi:hypothetical protein
MPRKGPHRYGAYERAHRHDTQLRVEARRYMAKKLGKKAIEGEDVDHVESIKGGGGNGPRNLRLRDPHANRGDKTF